MIAEMEKDNFTENNSITYWTINHFTKFIGYMFIVSIKNLLYFWLFIAVAIGNNEIR